MIQLTLTLKMTTWQAVETSVTFNNSPIQDYTEPNDHTIHTYDNVINSVIKSIINQYFLIQVFFAHCSEKGDYCYTILTSIISSSSNSTWFSWISAGILVLDGCSRWGTKGSTTMVCMSLISERQNGHPSPPVSCHCSKQRWHIKWPQGSRRTSLLFSAQILQSWNVEPISQYSSYCSSVTVICSSGGVIKWWLTSGLTGLPSGYR